jgi:hypothetical protein
MLRQNNRRVWVSGFVKHELKGVLKYKGKKLDPLPVLPHYRPEQPESKVVGYVSIAHRGANIQ